MRQRCTVSSIHTLRPTPIFVRIFIDIMHSPALYPNLFNWPPNPDLKSILTSTLKPHLLKLRGPAKLSWLSKNVLVESILQVQEQTHLLCAHGYTAQCVLLCSWAVWGQRGPCYTVLVLERQDSCCRWTGASQSSSKKQILCRTITFTNHCGGFQRVWTEMAKFNTQVTTGV